MLYENDEFCIKNDECCMQMMNLCMTMMSFGVLGVRGADL